MTYRGNTHKFQSSLKRRTTSTLGAKGNTTGKSNSSSLSQTIPPPNGQAMAAGNSTAALASTSMNGTATANFAYEPKTQKRTLNPQRGLNNATFNSTGRITLAESAPRKFIPPGYQGHVQGEQYIFGKSFSSISEAILTYRDDTQTPTKPNYQELI